MEIRPEVIIEWSAIVAEAFHLRTFFIVTCQLILNIYTHQLILDTFYSQSYLYLLNPARTIAKDLLLDHNKAAIVATPDNRHNKAYVTPLLRQA